MPDAQDLKEQLLRTDAEYRELYQLHHELDEQIRSMSATRSFPRANSSRKSASRNVSCSSRIGWKTSSDGSRTAAVRSGPEPGPRLTRAPNDPVPISRCPSQCGGHPWLLPCRGPLHVPDTMKLDRAGYPFIAGAFAPAAYFLLKKKPGLGLPLLGLAGFLAYFFRDPDRYPPQHPDLVLSPADGRGDGGRSRVSPASRLRERGSRSAFSCRRSTCTSTAPRTEAK